MIDTHSHLFSEEFELDLDECIERAKLNNVNKIILVGFSDETNQKAQDLAKKYDIFYPTAGVHPEECDENYLVKFNNLVEFIKHNKIYAIGECGLDYHWDITYKNEQQELLKLQCKLALDLDLPIIIHMRDASEDTYNILKDFKGLKGVMHCYSGSYEMSLKFLDLCFYISLGGPVTFKNAKEPKKNAELIPLERLLIETDCPFLAPMPFRGKRNESSYVKYVCEEIARIKNIDSSIVEAITEQNAINLFKL